MEDTETVQHIVCDRVGAKCLRPAPDDIIGVSKNLRIGPYPINGLRHPIVGITSGWYLWAGEYSSAPDFFEPMHVHHLRSVRPDALKYLGLAPGWRFLFDGKCEDVWFDESLLRAELVFADIQQLSWAWFSCFDSVFGEIHMSKRPWL